MNWDSPTSCNALYVRGINSLDARKRPYAFRVMWCVGNFLGGVSKRIFDEAIFEEVIQLSDRPIWFPLGRQFLQSLDITLFRHFFLSECSCYLVFGLFLF